jgi:ATP-dependent DNA helicase RecQ
MRSKPEEILRQYWGYDAFRPPQDRIIDAVLEGKDTLALLPTGGGKSICFQVPGMAMEGITLVISPLISLMKDQVENLKKRGIKASAIHTGMPFFIMENELNNCVAGHHKFLYLSPERLKTPRFLEFFRHMKVNLIAVDEAHCISQWGYDFRPVYLEIAEIRKFHPKVPVLALTATATPQVARDICEKLHFAKRTSSVKVSPAKIWFMWYHPAKKRK